MFSVSVPCSELVVFNLKNPIEMRAGHTSTWQGRSLRMCKGHKLSTCHVRNFESAERYHLTVLLYVIYALVRNDVLDISQMVSLDMSFLSFMM
jgi:hypothetical protein